MWRQNLTATNMWPTLTWATCHVVTDNRPGHLLTAEYSVYGRWI